MGVNSLPKTVIRQRRGCDLNPGPSAPESSTLTTRQCKELWHCCHHQSANVDDIIAKTRLALFGHVMRLDANTPAHQILKQGVDVKSGHRPNAQWQRPPGRPHNSWLQQTNKGSLTAMRQSWRAAEDCGCCYLPLLSVHYNDDYGDDIRYWLIMFSLGGSLLAKYCHLFKHYQYHRFNRHFWWALLLVIFHLFWKRTMVDEWNRCFTG